MKTALTFEDRKQFLLGDHVSKRFCYLCGKETLECVGSVNTTTFLQALQGEITFDEVKELCST